MRWPLVLSAFAAACAAATLFAAAQAGQPPAQPTFDTAWLEHMLRQTEWRFSYNKEQKLFVITTGERVLFCRTSGKDPVYVCLRAPIPNFPQRPPATLLRRLLQRNYEIYLGHYGLDGRGRLWFEINTPARLLDAAHLNRVILWVHREVDRARKLIEQPPEEK